MLCLITFCAVCQLKFGYKNIKTQLVFLLNKKVFLSSFERFLKYLCFLVFMAKV